MNPLVVAQEHLDKSLWNPTILGVLVVVFAIVLFCGSIYLLLGTNLGARLGFLVAFTGLMGFLALLTILWMTTASPLNTLKGRPSSWKVQEVVSSLDAAKTDKARTIADEGGKVDATESANVKAFVDEALAPPAEGAEGAGTSEFARFDAVTDFMTGDTFEVGGGNPNPLDFELTHEPKVAAVAYCEVLEVEVPFGLPPPEPECDPDSVNQGFVILELDLGSLRVPPVVAFVMFSVLFGLGLLALHWREQDEATAAQPAPKPVPVPSET